MKIIILNQNDGTIHVFNLDENIYDLNNFEIIDFYDDVNEKYDLHLKDSECSYMITNDLNIQIH